jgi:biopolymer transport protein ExbD
VKKAILWKVIYRFSAIPIKILETSLQKIVKKKKNPEIYIETQKTTKVKAIMSKVGNTKGMTIPDFQLYYRTIATKTWNWHKNRNRPMAYNRRPRNKPT